MTFTGWALNSSFAHASKKARHSRWVVAYRKTQKQTGLSYARISNQKELQKAKASVSCTTASRPVRWHLREELRKQSVSAINLSP